MNLQEIQAAVIQEDTEIGPILLKLRLLASRLGSKRAVGRVGEA
jgi:hypothetical protein